MTTAPPAGFYVDPEHAGFERWWDGAAWTGQRRPLASLAPPPPPPTAPASSVPPRIPGHVPGHMPGPREGQKGTATHWVVPMGRDPLAIIAGYLGLLSIIPVVGIVACVCGGLALQRISNGTTEAGRGRAWFGIVAGALGTILFVASIFM